MTIHQLRRAMEHYQIMLGMEDWKLTVRYQCQAVLRKRQKVNEDVLVYGDVDIKAKQRRAVITVGKPSEVAQYDPRPNLQITTLLHEMGHCLFDRNVVLYDDKYFEQGLDKFANFAAGLHG